MLIYKQGDILKATENIICHQVNVDGIMGGGLARQIAKVYPNVEAEYKKCCRCYCYDYEKLKSKAFIVRIGDLKFIANCFTQKSNFDTDYEAIKQVFKVLLIDCKKQNKTICIPYKYGCGIANGDWDVVSKIFETLSAEYQVDISVYKIGQEKKNE